MTDKKLKGIRAIAFDLDGTLTDSAVGLTEATDYALKAKAFLLLANIMSLFG